MPAIGAHAGLITADPGFALWSWLVLSDRCQTQRAWISPKLEQKYELACYLNETVYRVQAGFALKARCKLQGRRHWRWRSSACTSWPSC